MGIRWHTLKLKDCHGKSQGAVNSGQTGNQYPPSLQAKHDRFGFERSPAFPSTFNFPHIFGSKQANPTTQLLDSKLKKGSRKQSEIPTSAPYPLENKERKKKITVP